MGTRSITKIYDSRNNCLVAMYRQFDGYPSGQGKELAEFLTSGQLVNGMSDRSVKIFNGAACLAAAMVANFKTEPGGIYLYPINSADEEYNYDVRVAWVDRVQSDQDPIEIEVRAYGKSEFKGNRQAFLAWCTKPPEVSNA